MALLFFFIALGISYYLLFFYQDENLIDLYNFLGETGSHIVVWILAISPYIIYDPKLFYPRHVLISLVLIGVNFENLLSDYKYKNIKNNKK